MSSHHNDRDRFRHPDALVTEPEYQASAPLPEPVSGERRAGERRGTPAPRRKLRVGRIFGVFILLILLGVVGYGVYLASIVAKISTNPWQFSPVAADSTGRTNILILGIGDPGHAGQNLSDSMMLMSLDSQGKRMAQVSIPRDLRVKLDGYGYSKINVAHAYGGTGLARETVSGVLGVPVDYYVTTNFSGLKDIVDAVGGLEVDVKERLYDPEYPCTDNPGKSCGLEIEPGLQYMDGAQALAYVRCRKGTCGNDFGRAERQQEIVGLLRPKLTDPRLLLSPAKLEAVVVAVNKGVSTDLGLMQMLQLANTWREASKHVPVRLVLSTDSGGYLRYDPYGSSDLVPVGGSFGDIQERVRTIFDETKPE